MSSKVYNKRLWNYLVTSNKDTTTTTIHYSTISLKRSLSSLSSVVISSNNNNNNSNSNMKSRYSTIYNHNEHHRASNYNRTLTTNTDDASSSSSSSSSSIKYAFDPLPIPSLPVITKSSNNNHKQDTTTTTDSTIIRFPIHRVYCVGKNYADHVKEMGGDVQRSTPVFFMKPNDGVVFAGKGSTDTTTTPINYPPNTNNLHYEVELVVAIGKDQETTTTASHIDPKDAEQYIYGYAVGIDLTRRDLQNDAKERRGPWDVAKYFDQSAPMSPISTSISLQQIENDTTTIQLTVNGSKRQSAKINQMIWNISEIISELSKSFTLRQGDLIMTGTPAGVGPIEIGDRIVGTVDGLEPVDIILTTGRETQSLQNSKTATTHSPTTSQKRYIHTFQVSNFSSSSGKKNKENDDNKTKNNGTIKDDHPPQTAWKQLQSLPNIITLTRMASTPILCYWIVQEHYTMALYGCLFAAISDALDGYFAKHHGMSTVLGTYLDPIADKVLVNGLAISLWYTGILPTPLVALWATKDFILLAGTGWYLYKEQHTINFFDMSIATKPLTVTPTTLGKANTGLQFATLAVGIISPVVTTLPPSLLPSLCWVTGITTVGSVLSYTGQAGIKMTQEQQKDRGVGGVGVGGGGDSSSHKEDTTSKR